MAWFLVFASLPSFINSPLPKELEEYEEASFRVCHSSGCGTGWAYEKRGSELIVVTAAHVCGETVKSKKLALNIRVDDLPIKRAYIDQDNDICALVIDKPDQKKTLSLASANNTDDWILSRQELSGYRAKLMDLYYPNAFQGGFCRVFRGDAQAGSSGSAMIDQLGQVNCMVVIGFEGMALGACVPKRALQVFLDEVKRLESLDNRNSDLSQKF